MPELQEVSEHTLFCPTKVCHPGTAGCPAKTCDKACDQPFAKVVAPVIGQRIGVLIEGAKENVHARNGLQKGDPRPRLCSDQDRKTIPIRSNAKRDSPAGRTRNAFRFDGSIRQGYGCCI